MAIEKIVELVEVRIHSDGVIKGCYVDRIVEDGQTIAENLRFGRDILPGDDVSGEPQRIRNIAAAVHTPDEIAAYQAALEVG